MSSPCIGEIRLFACRFTPRSFAPCNGQPVFINQHNALFALIGTVYGDDGGNYFNLPNLKGRVAIGIDKDDPKFDWGKRGGHAMHQLSEEEMPEHEHRALTRFTKNKVSDQATNNWLSRSGPGGTQSFPFYRPAPGEGQVQLSDQAVRQAGGNKPHENRQPFLCINYYISLQGMFPVRE